MIAINKKALITIVIVLLVLTIVAIIYYKQDKSEAKPDPWYAMSRHGECVNLERIIKFTPLFKGARTLHDMEMILQIKEIEYNIEATPPDRSRFIKFNVPSEEIGMMMIKKQYCQEFNDEY